MGRTRLKDKEIARDSHRLIQCGSYKECIRGDYSIDARGYACCSRCEQAFSTADALYNSEANQVQDESADLAKAIQASLQAAKHSGSCHLLPTLRRAVVTLHAVVISC